MAKVSAWLLFGLIGMAAFVYGRRQSKPKAMAVAGLLMVYPYLVEDALLLWLIGAGLTASLFCFRDD